MFWYKMYFIKSILLDLRIWTRLQPKIYSQGLGSSRIAEENWKHCRQVHKCKSHELQFCSHLQWDIDRWWHCVSTLDSQCSFWSLHKECCWGNQKVMKFVGKPFSTMNIEWKVYKEYRFENERRLEIGGQKKAILQTRIPVFFKSDVPIHSISYHNHCLVHSRGGENYECSVSSLISLLHALPTDGL